MKLLQLSLRFLEVIRTQGVAEAIRRSKFVLRRVFYSVKKRIAYFPLTWSIKRSASSVAGETRISILMPVYNTDPRVLTETIESVLAQTYQNWELCICDDCSTSNETMDVLGRYKGHDPRIKITRSSSNLHISGATNLAMEFATGEFVTFLDHDDTLAQDAIECVANAIHHYPEADLLYTDEDKIMANGSHVEPHYKPSWSPEYLHAVMYLMHLFVIRKKLLLELGGLREQFSGAQDYDLALRASKKARQIVHIPKILYHWRRVPGSAATHVDAKPQALLNAHAALESAVKEYDADACVLNGLMPGSFRVQWPIPSGTEVTLLIPTNAQRAEVKDRGNILLVRNLLESITKKSTWQKYKILVIDNHNLSPEDSAYVESLGGTVVHYSYDGKFNFSKKMNFAFEHVDTEHVIILNDDTEVISNDWIEALLSFSTQESIGAVGAKLLFPNDKIQHAGILINEDADCVHAYYNLSQSEAEYFGYGYFIRNYPAVTGAAMATRMSLVKQIGGFREEFGTDYNDVDFCLRLGAQGFRSVYTPFASLYHFENTSIKRTAADSSESSLFKSLWKGNIPKELDFIPDSTT
jgi:GT2 family glycosyltransferase